MHVIFNTTKSHHHAVLTVCFTCGQRHLRSDPQGHFTRGERVELRILKKDGMRKKKNILIFPQIRSGARLRPGSSAAELNLDSCFIWFLLHY